MILLFALLSLIAPQAEAAPPCPEAAQGVAVTRSEIQSYTRRIFEGYRNQDVTSVVPARDELRCAIPQLVEDLGTYDVATIHLAFAASAAMEARPDEEVARSLVAARASDPRADVVLEQAVGEDDPLVVRYRALAGAEAPSPDLAANLAETGALPPAWRARIQVNGSRDARIESGPTFYQVVGFDGDVRASSYIDVASAGDAAAGDVTYTRLRPVQGGLILGTAVVGTAAFALGLWQASRVEPWELPTGDTVEGDEVARSVEDWREDRARKVTANHVFMGVAAASSAATLGLGLWWVSTF